MPQYIAHGFSWDALLPYYSLQGLPDVVGYILSAVIADVLPFVRRSRKDRAVLHHHDIIERLIPRIIHIHPAD